MLKQFRLARQHHCSLAASVKYAVGWHSIKCYRNMSGKCCGLLVQIDGVVSLDGRGHNGPNKEKL